MIGQLHPLTPGKLDKSLLLRAAEGKVRFTLPGALRHQIGASTRAVHELANQYEPVFGINSGFGTLGSTRIRDDHLSQIQRNLVLSHCVGSGAALAAPVVRLMLLLKSCSLAHGLSGVRDEVIDGLLSLMGTDVLPVVPEKSSAGSPSGLTALAHLCGVLIGHGETTIDGKRVPASQGLVQAGFAPLELGPKEGLALLSGTQAATALGLHALQRLERILDAAVAVGAMSMDAAKASDTPLDDRIHTARGQTGQREIAGRLRAWLFSSELRLPHQHTEQIQSPYAFRCQPQVLGACFDQMQFATQILLREANAASDNPLVFAETLEALGGGNLHDAPVALAADGLALAISEIGALSERRTALLMEPALSGLPAHLVEESEVNTGFRIALATAAALVAENKGLARPVTVEAAPAAPNQEDPPYMAFAATRRLHTMLDNAANIVAIEWMAAAQGLDFRRPLQSSPALELLYSQLRDRVPFLGKDRPVAPDITAATLLVEAGVPPPD
jgi:histidine ammonia-lyase